MAVLFQNFILNFYRKHVPDSRPRAEQIAWDVVAADNETEALLPRMTTDITLDSDLGRLIIDTKYYSQTLSDYYGAEKVHSGNLYQLMSYLTNAKATLSTVPRGMLLYPVVKQELRLAYTIQGFSVQVCTVDLARDWKAIELELLELIGAAGRADETGANSTALA